MAALVLKAPALVISATEAQQLAAALRNLSQYYNVVPNPKIMAWFQLLAVCAAVYGPRVAMMAMQAKRAREDKARGFAPMGNPAANGATNPQPQNRDPQPGPVPMQGVYKFQ